MSSITTKTGDKGTTRLYSGETVSKRSKRIAACGDIDELVSMLGIAYASVDKFGLSCEPFYLSDIVDEITYIQRKLFDVASEIATLEPRLSQLPNRITTQTVVEIDYSRTRLEGKIELPKGFILPGANKLSSYLDMARSISRRCERSIVEIYNEGFISNDSILIWMNRLSDYLYLLARYAEQNQYRMVKS